MRRRTDAHTGETSNETVYAITSLGHRYTSTVLLASWLRHRWTIENSVHSQVRTAAGPHVMATIRNTALNISRLAGHTSIAAVQRHDSWTPDAAVHAA